MQGTHPSPPPPRKRHTMPITLDRYTRLLSFARELLDKSAILANHATHVRHKANQAQTLDEAYDLILELSAGIESIRLHDPEMMQKFLEEEQHFRFTASRSSKAAHYMRRYRQRQKAKRTEFDNEEFLHRTLVRREDVGDGPFVDTTAQLPPPPPQQIQKVKEPTSDSTEAEVAQPVGKGRNPMLDQITLDFMYTRLRLSKNKPARGQPHPTSRTSIAKVERERTKRANAHNSGSPSLKQGP
jgi:hypothetical protein